MFVFGFWKVSTDAPQKIMLGRYSETKKGHSKRPTSTWRRCNVRRSTGSCKRRGRGSLRTSRMNVIIEIISLDPTTNIADLLYIEGAARTVLSSVFRVLRHGCR